MLRDVKALLAALARAGAFSAVLLFCVGVSFIVDDRALAFPSTGAQGLLALVALVALVLAEPPRSAEGPDPQLSGAEQWFRRAVTTLALGGFIGVIGTVALFVAAGRGGWIAAHMGASFELLALLVALPSLHYVKQGGRRAFGVAITLLVVPALLSVWIHVPRAIRRAPPTKEEIARRVEARLTANGAPVRVVDLVVDDPTPAEGGEHVGEARALVYRWRASAEMTRDGYHSYCPAEHPVQGFFREAQKAESGSPCQNEAVSKGTRVPQSGAVNADFREETGWMEGGRRF
jgi:hypothetical protein